MAEQLPQDACCNHEVNQPSPPGAIPRCADDDIETAFIFAHRTVVLEHPHTKGVRTARQSHVVDVRVQGIRLHPGIVIALQTVDETRGVLRTAIVRGHLDGEVVLVGFQIQRLSVEQSLLQQHMPLIFTTCLYQLIVDDEPTEHGLFLLTVTSQFARVDHVETVLSAYQQQTFLRVIDCSLVERSGLQTVAVAKAAHGKRPETVFLFGRDVRYAMIRHSPDGTPLIFRQRHDTVAIEARLHIEQRTLFRPAVEHVDTRCRSLPDESSVVHQCLGGRR